MKEFKGMKRSFLLDEDKLQLFIYGNDSDMPSALQFFMEESESDALMEFSVQFDHNFNKWLWLMYNSISRDFSKSTIDYWGNEVLKYLDLAKDAIVKASGTDSFKGRIVLAAKAIIYKYGYGNALNNAIDYGFISKLLMDRVQEAALKNNVSEAEILQELDSLSEPSLFLKRTLFAERLLSKLAREGKITSVIGKAKSIISTHPFMELDSALKQEFSSFDDKLFSEYMSLFCKDYFPYYSAFKLLLASDLQHAQSSTCKKESTGLDIDPTLVDAYRSIKFWKDKTSVHLDYVYRALYYDLFNLIDRSLGLSADEDGVVIFMEKIKEKLCEFGITDINEGNKGGV